MRGKDTTPIWSIILETSLWSTSYNFQQCQRRSLRSSQHYCSRYYSKLAWYFSFDWRLFPHVYEGCSKYTSFFKFLGTNLPGWLTDEYTEKISDKTRVISLPLHKNESHYTDVVDIMSYYVTLLQRVYQKARISEIPKTLIGGDLLTRVLMSGSILLTIKAPTSAQHFDCLSFISEAFFHHVMKILSVISKCLWDKGSGPDLGTMRNQQICIL